MENLPARWQRDDIITDPAWFEDDEDYLVVDGHRRHIVDGDIGAALLGAPVAFVNKETGTVSYVPYLLHRDRIAAMRRVPPPTGDLDDDHPAE